MSVFPNHLKQLQSGGVQSRQGLSAEKVNGGSSGHPLALKRPGGPFSISLEGPCGCALTSSSMNPLPVSFEGPPDEEQQQGQKKGEAGESGIHSSHNTKGKGPLPTSTHRCSSQRPKWPPWVGLHNAPFISDSPGSPTQTRLPSLP